MTGAPALLLVGGITAGAIALFVSGRLRPDLVALLVLVSLAVTGVLTPEEAVSGFASPATITVLAMLVLAAGLTATGATARAGRLIGRLGGTSPALLLVALMTTAAVLSAFVNNTAVVAVLLPVVVKLAADHGLSASKLLIPLSFASMFGGTMTLMGTSTNLLVDAVARREGLVPFGLFEFGRLGVVFVAVGLLYMLTLGRWLLPARKKTRLTDAYQLRDYLTEIEVDEKSPLVGRAIGELDLEKEHGVEILDVFRGHQRLGWLDRVKVEAADVLLVRGPVKELMALAAERGLSLRPEMKLGGDDADAEDLVLLEAVVAPTSRLRGRTPRQVLFRRRYRLTILALQRRGQRLHDRLADTPLGVGDTLLLQGRRDDVDEVLRDADFLILGEVDVPVPQRRKMWLAVAIMVGVAALPALGVLPILVSALAGAAAMVLVGCLTMQDASETVDWSVVFLLAGVIPLGLALERTGAAALLAGAAVLAVERLGLPAAVAVFYGVTSLLTEVLSNNATAVLLAPIAIATAAELGLDPRPLLVAIAFAASASFMTPLGYQTNLLVFGPGGYRYADYLRVGGPLNVLFWVVASLLIPVFWPLT